VLNTYYSHEVEEWALLTPGKAYHYNCFDYTGGWPEPLKGILSYYRVVQYTGFRIRVRRTRKTDELRVRLSSLNVTQATTRLTMRERSIYVFNSHLQV